MTVVLCVAMAHGAAYAHDRSRSGTPDVDLGAAAGLVRVTSETPTDHVASMPTPHGPALGLGDHGGQFEKLDLSGIGSDGGPIL
ncbi:MAG: hypothetical protein CMJ31_02320, partial [Phycisphaerae bacterium]|nr:hypothetical protein [Phycisphaerae bacterium]